MADGSRTRHPWTIAVYAIGGIAVTAALVLGGFALAGSTLSSPTGPILPSGERLGPSSTDGPSNGRPKPRSTPSRSDDRASGVHDDHGGQTSGSDDGAATSGGDDHGGSAGGSSGSDNSASGSGSSGSGSSGSSGGGSDDGSSGGGGDD
jgi:hypothetical protein